MRAPLLHLLIVFLVATAHPVAAQDTPVVFVHGFGADERTWEATSERLRQRLAIEPFVRGLNWTNPFEAQAGELNGKLPVLPPHAIAVGHSNGGLVSREWARGRSLGGLVTVGSPNSGAPLLANLLEVVGFNQRLWSISGLALGAVGARGFETVLMYVQAGLLFAQQIGSGTIEGLALIGLNAGWPVTSQMVPWSPFISSLNGGSNLSREAASIRSRIGLTYMARNYAMLGPARAIAPDRADGYYVDMWAAIYALELAANYLGTMSTNPTALFISNSLRNVSSTLRDVDPFWCQAVTYDRTCSTPHDGVVSLPYQSYPGAYNVVLSGPAHIQEARQSDDALYAAFTQRLGVLPRSNAPPAPPRPSSSNALGVDGTLTAGQRLVSVNGQFQLEYQHDGNVVLYRMSDGAALWATGTGAPAGMLVMQSDGNLVIYAEDGHALWATGTVNYPGAVLELQDDGNLVVYSYNGAPIWDSGTAQ